MGIPAQHGRGFPSSQRHKGSVVRPLHRQREAKVWLRSWNLKGVVQLLSPLGQRRGVGTVHHGRRFAFPGQSIGITFNLVRDSITVEFIGTRRRSPTLVSWIVSSHVPIHILPIQTQEFSLSKSGIKAVLTTG